MKVNLCRTHSYFLDCFTHQGVHFFNFENERISRSTGIFLSSEKDLCSPNKIVMCHQGQCRAAKQENILIPVLNIPKIKDLFHVISHRELRARHACQSDRAGLRDVHEIVFTESGRWKL